VIPLQTDWYVDLIENGEVREATRAAWQQALADLAQLPPLDDFQMKWERTALFAYHLASRLGRSRAVYVLHGPMHLQLPGPPYFVGLSHDLVALQFEKPPLTPQKRDKQSLASWPGGVELVAFEPDREQAGTGEMVPFRVRWRFAGPVPPRTQFALGLAPELASADYFKGVLAREGLFVQPFPLLYGLTEVETAERETACEQAGVLIIPTNAPPGAYRVAVGIGPLYSTEHAGWVEVDRMRVESRPRPRNGP